MTVKDLVTLSKWITNTRHSWLVERRRTHSGLGGVMGSTLVTLHKVHPPCGRGRTHSLRVCTRVSGSGIAGCISSATVLSRLVQNNSLLLERCWPCSPPEPWDHSTVHPRPGENKTRCLYWKLDPYSLRVIPMEGGRRRGGRAGGEEEKIFD